MFETMLLILCTNVVGVFLFTGEIRQRVTVNQMLEFMSLIRDYNKETRY